MSAPSNQYAFNLEVAATAAERWSTREQHHAKFEKAARNKQYSKLDSPERLAARTNRLLCKLKIADPDVTQEVASEFDPSLSKEIANADITAESVSDTLLERVMGRTRDFQSIAFLEQGAFASKSVGRIVTKLSQGRVSYGTGFMVSPQLLMTNHHVLPSPEAAARSTIEFDYQHDRFGRVLNEQSFKLDPTTFFINDKELDFALVAVLPDSFGRLKDYNWCPLFKEVGKIVTGEVINIIQHPKGDRKQIVIRENRLLDAFDGADLFLHYEADTEPGSSGSPVFNDQWEVVALHHSGVPRRNQEGEWLDIDGNIWKKGDDPSRLDWVANEGVRVSKLVEFIAKAPVKRSEKKLVKELLDAKPPIPEASVLLPPQSEQLPSNSKKELHPMSDSITVNGGHGVTLTIPLHITITLGVPQSNLTNSTVTPLEPDETLLEKVEIDPDFASRQGYDPDFLGFKVPFPKLTNVTRSKAYSLPGLSGEEQFQLKYHHYSIIFNKERKLAFVAGVNLDPTAPFHHKRDKKDEWFYDPRVKPDDLQAGEDLYANNPLDRGHLVRRADAGWGYSEEEAKLANDDTFHFTNCSPQHAITNQGKTKITDRGREIKAPRGLKLWGKLEDHISAQGQAEKQKLCVFNGPVFSSTDEKYRGVQIPQEFWKVVVFENDAGEPAATAFVLTQADLIQGLEEEFEVGEYKTVQVRIKDLEIKTELDFGKLRNWDVLEQDGAEESFTSGYPVVVLESVKDVVLSPTS